MEIIKKPIFILLIFFNVAVYAQLPTNEKGEISYTKVVNAEGSTKKQLYDKAKLWIVSKLKSGDNMVELSSENADQIVGTGNLILEDIYTGFHKKHKITNVSLNFKFIVFCKEGRFKYELSNLIIHYVWVNYQSKSIPESCGLVKLTHPGNIKKEDAVKTYESNVRKAVHAQLTNLIADFTENMTVTKEEDW